MDNGFYKMTQRQYNKIEAVNWSTLKRMIGQSPYAFKKVVLDDKKPIKVTPEMQLGSAVHMMILEPHLAARYILNKIEGDGKTNAIKEARALQLSQNPDAIILDQEQKEMAAAMVQSIKKNEYFDRYLANGKAELTLVWTDLETGIKCKGRIDYVNANAICDVKTTKDQTPQDFSDSCFDDHYFGQAAFYVNAWKSLKGTDQDFVFAAISKKEPYESWFTFVNDEQLLYGQRLVSKLLRQLKQCQDSNNWPKLDGICELKLSDWRQKRMTNFLMENEG